MKRPEGVLHHSPVFAYGADFLELKALLGLGRHELGLKKAQQLVKSADRPAFSATARRLEAEFFLALDRGTQARATLAQAARELELCDRPFEKDRVASLLAQLPDPQTGTNANTM
jgi:hypothetical protein